MVGSDHTGSDTSQTGSNGGSNGSVGTTPGSDVGSNNAGSAEPLGPKPVHVIITTEPDLTEFDILENNVKIPDALDFVPVVPGKPRSVVIRAKGFKDKPVVLDGTKTRIAVRLEAKSTGPGPGPGPGSNHGGGLEQLGHQHPGPNCNATILDNSKHCRDQYCAHHPDDMAHGCGTE